MDFLFEYYSFRPARLARWTPGFGTRLLGTPDALADFRTTKGFVVGPRGAWLAPDRFPHRRRRSARWIRDLLARTQARSPNIGCFGLHEWAMVYRADTTRHTTPLRLHPDAIAELVESRPIACTHHDAFRFFTPPARPLNRYQPTFETMSDLEQPGCIHTNMDLYRWAYKLHPWLPSDLVADCFELAQAARLIDMRASPYDLRDRGLDPILIETEDGRAAYRQHQRNLHTRAAPLRARLIEAYDRVLAWLPSDTHSPNTKQPLPDRKTTSL